MTDRRPREEHLRAEDCLFLVLPPAGEPEPLPAHLSACPACARQFAEWRSAAEGLAAGGENPPLDFETNVMARVRAMAIPRSRRRQRRWAAGLSAAACLLAAFWLGTRAGTRTGPGSPPVRVTVTSMSESDRADDELLRDVSRLVSSEDETNWRSLAPLPPAPGGTS